MEKKNEIIVGLEYMANVMGPILIISILLGIILANIELPYENIIIYLIGVLLTFGLVFYKAKYILKKYEFNDLPKVALFSTIGLFIINITLVFIVTKVEYGNRIESGYDETFLSILFNNLGIGNHISFILAIIFYSAYYFSSIKSLEYQKNKLQ